MGFDGICFTPNVWLRSSVGNGAHLVSGRHGLESPRNLNFANGYIQGPYLLCVLELIGFFLFFFISYSFQMSIVGILILLIPVITWHARLTDARSDCAQSCFGIWNFCLTGCKDFNGCAKHCNSGLERCRNGCLGSRVVKNIPSFHKVPVKRHKHHKKTRRLQNRFKGKI